MSYFSKITLFSITIFFLSAFVPPNYKSAPERLKGMFLSTHQIETMSYHFVRTERINGEMVQNKSDVKIQRRPYKFYLKETYPHTGVEVLYPHPTDEKKALINPNGFPWMNLKLDPNGELMRKGQHHTVLEGGYDYVVSILEYYFYKYRDELDELIVYEADTMIDGKQCSVVTIQNKGFNYYEYTVKKGESISSIALKNRLNEYMIVQKNEGLEIYSSLESGQKVVLASDYCSMMRLYIDQDRQIPLKMEVYDEVGIFEAYEFQKVKINPSFAIEEFEITNSDYNF